MPLSLLTTFGCATLTHRSMWTIVIPIVISVLSLALGLWNFFEQRVMKKNDRLESNWRHLLDHLDPIKPEWRNETDDTGPGTLALIVGTSNLGDVSGHLKPASDGRNDPATIIGVSRHFSFNQAHCNSLLSGLFERKMPLCSKHLTQD